MWSFSVPLLCISKFLSVISTLYFRGQISFLCLCYFLHLALAGMLPAITYLYLLCKFILSMITFLHFFFFFWARAHLHMWWGGCAEEKEERESQAGTTAITAWGHRAWRLDPKTMIWTKIKNGMPNWLSHSLTLILKHSWVSLHEQCPSF